MRIATSTNNQSPDNILKMTYQVFISVRKDLVNLSLSQGSMDSLKSVVLLPLLNEMEKIMDSDI